MDGLLLLPVDDHKQLHSTSNIDPSFVVDACPSFVVDALDADSDFADVVNVVAVACLIAVTVEAAFRIENKSKIR